MKVPDANVLIYAIDPASAHHEVAREWVETSFSAEETIGLAWMTLLSVVRLTTNPSVFESPLEPSAALELVDEWVAQPAVTTIEPTARHPELLRTLLTESGAAGNLTSDAHLAALAIEHGAMLASFDADFHRFSGLRFEYLLREPAGSGPSPSSPRGRGPSGPRS